MDDVVNSLTTVLMKMMGKVDCQPHNLYHKSNLQTQQLSAGACIKHKHLQLVSHAYPFVLPIYLIGKPI